MRKASLAIAAVLTLLAGGAVAQQALKSGPQVGEQVPGPFHPLNLTGAAAGEKHCLYCEHGTSPVAMIFAREVSPALTTLVKKIDAANGKNAGMGSFVVFLSDSEKLGKDLKDMAVKEGLKKTVLSIDNPAGPAKYSVAKDADVTVVLYSDHTVRANFAFRRGELTSKGVDTVVAALPTILNSK
jgi:hypothetical protein